MARAVLNDTDQHSLDRSGTNQGPDRRRPIGPDERLVRLQLFLRVYGVSPGTPYE